MVLQCIIILNFAVWSCSDSSFALAEVRNRFGQTWKSASASCHGRSENLFWANMEICFGSSAHLYLHPPWANCLSDLALIQVSLWPKWESVLGKHGNLLRLHIDMSMSCHGQSENPFQENMEICFGFILTCQCHVRSRSFTILLPSFTLLTPSLVQIRISSLLFNISNGGKIPVIDTQTTATFLNFAKLRTDVRLG